MSNLKRVNLSIPKNRISKILDIGRQTLLRANDKKLKLTTICTSFVFFILEIYNDPDVQAYLKKTGGTLFDLIRRAVKAYVEKD